jgi:hypothetical protein
VTVKFRLKHLTITRSPQNWSGTVINPWWNWLSTREFNWYGYQAIETDPSADQLARLGSEHPSTGPEPAWGISVWTAKRVVTDWINTGHKKCWGSITGVKHAFPARDLSARKSRELLKLSRNQLQQVTWIFTGHCHQEGQLLNWN